MSKEKDIAFALLRSSIDGQQPLLETQSLTTSEWWSEFRLLQQNHVSALASVAIEKLDLPREVRVPWLAEREKAIKWYRYQLEVQQDIVNRMTKHGIETMILKGTHTAQYYPTAELREFGDLDFFFKQHQAADTVAQHELGVDITNTSHHHTKYAYRGVTIESHYDFINSHYPPSNQQYEQLLKQLAPSETFEILFMLRHLAGHFAASRITLRDVIDWYLACRTLINKVDWAAVQKTVVDYGMECYASALCSIVEHRFGYKIPLADVANQDCEIETEMVENDIIFGDTTTVDKGLDGIVRLPWKLKRHNAMKWKRRMVYNDSSFRLWIAAVCSHIEKPDSIIHKQ